MTLSYKISLNIIVFLFLSFASIINTTKNFTMDLTMDNNEVPDNTTVYLCKMFEVDKILMSEVTPSDTRYQLIETDAILSTSTVHHVLLYGCKDNAKYSTEVKSCDRYMNPDCPYILGGATLGTNKITLPSQVGLDWGVDD